MRETASKTQKAYFVWEMQLELLKSESSANLLQLIIKGDLVRSTTMFALLQINSALQSRTLESWLPMMLRQCCLTLTRVGAYGGQGHELHEYREPAEVLEASEPGVNRRHIQ
jgi:hypothetical protein